jgi:hypothetical protein
LLGVAENGNKVWKWTWDGTKESNTSLTQPGMIIFSNHGSPQTADLKFQNGGYYNEKGLVKTIPPTSIHAINSANDIDGKIYTLDGRLVRTAPKGSDALSGLAKGIYIVNKKKFILN